MNQIGDMKQFHVPIFCSRNIEHIACKYDKTISILCNMLNNPPPKKKSRKQETTLFFLNYDLPRGGQRSASDLQTRPRRAFYRTAKLSAVRNGKEEK